MSFNAHLFHFSHVLSWQVSIQVLVCINRLYWILKKRKWREQLHISSGIVMALLHFGTIRL